MTGMRRGHRGLPCFGCKTVPYTKPWKSYDEQLQLLISRGMLVSDMDRGA